MLQPILFSGRSFNRSFTSSAVKASFRFGGLLRIFTQQSEPDSCSPDTFASALLNIWNSIPLHWAKQESDCHLTFKRKNASNVWNTLRHKVGALFMGKASVPPKDRRTKPMRGRMLALMALWTVPGQKCSAPSESSPAILEPHASPFGYCWQRILPAVQIEDADPQPVLGHEAATSAPAPMTPAPAVPPKAADTYTPDNHRIWIHPPSMRPSVGRASNGSIFTHLGRSGTIAIFPASDNRIR